MTDLLILAIDDFCESFADDECYETRTKSDSSKVATPNRDGKCFSTTRRHAQRRVPGLERTLSVEVFPRQHDVSGTGGGQFRPLGRHFSGLAFAADGA